MAAVALVCMPWHVARSPSIQIGILQAALREQGIASTAHSLHLQFAHWASRRAPDGRELLSLPDYLAVGDRWFTVGAGEFVFAVPPVRAADRGADRRFLDHLRRAHVPASLCKRLVRLRDHVPRFLEACADEILREEPAVVGFTTTFGQTLPALALAAVLKRRAPELLVALGGAACEAGMGEALHRRFEVVDVVVRGEGERVFPAIVAAHLAGEPLPRLPGLVLRENGASVAVPEAPASVAMDRVPTPDYDEYFARLARLGLAADVQPVLPYESSRGCWWGEKSHCTFCGLNGQSMAHRSKQPQRVLDELRTLAARHQVLDFAVVDNIVDLDYFRSVLPALAASGIDWRLFWQTKANLSLDQVRLLRDAGVRWIRPGIESLDTEVLTRMAKGVTALQNVRLLKWCAQFGVHVAWNVIHGLPDDRPEQYLRMADLAASLVHFSPPALVELTLDRFSPFHQDPARHGIRVLGPPAHAEALWGLPPEELSRLAWTFEHRIDGAADTAREVAALRQAIGRWRAEHAQNQHALTWRSGPDFTVVDDARTTTGRRQFVLDAFESRVHAAADAGGTVPMIAAEMARHGCEAADLDAVRAVLDEFVAERLAWQENGRYLTLAVAAESLRSAARSPAQQAGRSVAASRS